MSYDSIPTDSAPFTYKTLEIANEVREDLEDYLHEDDDKTSKTVLIENRLDDNDEQVTPFLVRKEAGYRTTLDQPIRERPGSDMMFPELVGVLWYDQSPEEALENHEGIQNILSES